MRLDRRMFLEHVDISRSFETLILCLNRGEGRARIHSDRFWVNLYLPGPVISGGTGEGFHQRAILKASLVEMPVSGESCMQRTLKNLTRVKHARNISLKFPLRKLASSEYLNLSILSASDCRTFQFLSFSNFHPLGWESKNNGSHRPPGSHVASRLLANISTQKDCLIGLKIGGRPGFVPTVRNDLIDRVVAELMRIS